MLEISIHLAVLFNTGFTGHTTISLISRRIFYSNLIFTHQWSNY